MINPTAILRTGSCGLALLSLALSPVPPVFAGPGKSRAPSSATADAGQPAAIIAAVRAISTMRADFVQTDANGQRVSGVFTLKRPRKFRFQYQPDYPMLILADGRALLMIDYEVRQVQRWPLHYTPVGVLLDPGRDVSRIARLAPSTDASVAILLIHDRGHRENGDMTLTFTRNGSAPGGWEIAGWEEVDAQNRRTAVRLAHQQYGIEVSDDMFKWTDPRQPALR